MIMMMICYNPLVMSIDMLILNAQTTIIKPCTHTKGK